MTKDKRRKLLIRKRNFLPTLLVIMFLWATLVSMVYFVDPNIYGAILVFFIVFIASLIFTLSTLFANTTKGVVISLATGTFLLLRYLGIGNFVNFFLIAGFAFAVCYYLEKK